MVIRVYLTGAEIVCLFIAIFVAVVCIRLLLANYSQQYLNKKRFCNNCLVNNKEANPQSQWTLKLLNEKAPSFLCSKCKRELFPGDLGKTMETFGILKNDLDPRKELEKRAEIPEE